MQHNTKLALSLASLFIGMVLLAFASVPLYNIFCKVTGFGGTTQQAIKYATHHGKREIKVFFDSNTSPNLPWRFTPQQRSITIKPGENILVFYEAENLSNNDIIGTAIYNVTPNKAGIYFNKIHCFCFEEQLLKAKQKLLMPVSFYLDPGLETDENMQDIDQITLSYSFFKVRDGNK